MSDIWIANQNKLESSCISVSFDDTIQEILQRKGRILVLLRPLPGNEDNRNVYCVSDDGAVLWRVDGDEKNRSGAAGVYVGITGMDNDFVTITNFGCWAHVVDLNNGFIVKKTFVK